MAEKIDFEGALKELEQLVDTMEEGKLTLEESLQAYERGITLTNECREFLENAKARIDRLAETDPEADNDE